ncbi:MAG: hypothetical protein N2C14_18320 [Planctomycetales bacterium]
MYRQDERTGRWVEFVVEDDRTPVPDQAAFRLDFPVWLESLSERNREIAEEMAMNESTKDLARRHRVSPARVSQLRREFKDSWEAFHEEDDLRAAV